jgi:hypothetical protein
MNETFAIDAVDSSPHEVPGDAQNRRRDTRRLAYWPVSFQTLSGKWHGAKTDNVSAGGLQVIADVSFPPGTKLFVRIPVVYREYKRQLEAIVETRYSVATNLGFKVGMMFLRISDADRAFLKKYSEKDI